MPTPPTSPAELLNLVRRSGIAPADRIATVVPNPGELPPEPRRAASELIRRGLLTRFQAQQLLQGRHKGFRLGPHIVLDLLGRGGMGAVYLAEHQDLHRKVAIKVMVPPRDEDQQLATERFLREARAAAALDHPNIVRIFDVGRYNGVPYLAMEYVEGETLQQVLDRDGALPHTAAVDAVAQAAAGLQHAHERGFIHRDIKPGNLIRDKAGVVKILDMGLARSFDDPDQKLTEQLDSGAVVGTADFIAPEQALNLPQVDIRADIYSLGATFFALLAGRPPFEGNTTQKLLLHQMKTAPRLSEVAPALPAGLSDVVAKMLAKKPAERYSTPAEVIAALSPWVGVSHRVVAGWSRTSLASESGIFPGIGDSPSGINSLSLATVEPGEYSPDSEEITPFAPFSPAPETKPVASADTARSPGTKRTRRAASPVVADADARKAARMKTVLYVLGGLALLVFGVLLGRLAFG